MRFFLISALLTFGCYALDRTTEASEALITDAQSECSPYYYPDLAAHSAELPDAWKTATILSSDSEAQSLWKTIEPQVPNIPPKPVPGSPQFSHFNYPQDDPHCWWSYNNCGTPKLQGLLPDIVDVPEPNTLGYGFDDGPNCSHNAFYDFLASRGQKATMFYIGSNVYNWPLEAQRGLIDGHELSVHTWSHGYMTSLSSSSVFAELYYTMKVIKLVTGVTPKSWRPPFGDIDDRVRFIAARLNLTTIIWKYDSFDWTIGTGGVTKAEIDTNYENFIDTAKNGTFASRGAIMLTHELNNFTMQETIDYYDSLQKAFDHIVPVGVAHNITKPYVEQNYTMPTFEQYVNGTATSSNNLADASQSRSAGLTGSGTSSAPVATSGAGIVRSCWVGKLFMIVFACILL